MISNQLNRVAATLLAASVMSLLQSVTARKCTLLVQSELRPDRQESNQFECIMEASDIPLMEGTPNQADDGYYWNRHSVPIEFTEEQKAELMEKLEKGEIVSNVSTIDIDAGFELINNEILLAPKDLQHLTFGLNNDAGRRHNRHLATTVTGNKPILVIRVTDSQGRAVPYSAEQVSDDIFGSKGDSMTLQSQMKACSMGKLNIYAGTVPGHPDIDQKSPGVIEVEIDIDLKDSSRTVVRNAVLNKARTQYGIQLPGSYQQVMIVLEGCYQQCGWAAYAYVNSWLSVYQGDYYKYVGVQMHEIGHNFNLLHSGGLDQRTYTDHTGLMGNPLYHDDIGAMCFNAAKTWQIGWYDDRKTTVDPLDGAWTGKIIGVVDYMKISPFPVVVKIDTGSTSGQLYIAFNRAQGINRDNVQADDQVTIVETNGSGDNASQSFLRAHLAEGQQYAVENWNGSGKTLTVKATAIHLSTSSEISYADVQICLGDCNADPKPPGDNNDDPTCSDSLGWFDIVKPDGVKKRKTCKWAQRKWTSHRCNSVQGLKENCPLTCTNCCKDSTEKFQLLNGKPKDCAWAKLKPEDRCMKNPTRLRCPQTCGVCSA